jgi:hypothetical protein
MDHKGYHHIPRALFDAITFLCQSLPKRSVPTFLELLFGAMLTQSGFVTDSRLARRGGNSGKLVAARTMLRVVAPLFQELQTYLLMDSWYMRCKLITYAIEQGFAVIGQVRKDTALFHVPERTGKRGRPRKYGERVTAGWIASLPEVRQQLTVYGKTQTVYYRSAVVLARFLKGRAVRMVWSQFEKEDGTRSQQCLILSTDIALSGARIILGYGRRWSIEDLFNQLKNRWGWKETWQQTRQVLHRWVQILFVSYAIPQLLVLLNDAKVTYLDSFSP